MPAGCLGRNKSGATTDPKASRYSIPMPMSLAASGCIYVARHLPPTLVVGGRTVCPGRMVKSQRNENGWRWLRIVVLPELLQLLVLMLVEEKAKFICALVLSWRNAEVDGVLLFTFVMFIYPRNNSAGMRPR